MTKRFEILIIGLILTVSIFSQNLTSRLESAYNKNSRSELRDFFKDWHSSYEPVDQILLNDTLKAIYDIYKKFYLPNKLSKIGLSEWGNNIYRDTKYITIQNKIYYEFIETLNLDTIELNSILDYYPAGLTYKSAVDSSYGNESFMTELVIEKLKHFGRDSIIDFRPDIKIACKKILYLVDDYYYTVNGFLKNEFDPLGTGGIMNPARSKGESKKRQKFLEKYIKVIHGHWGGYWLIETHPKVNYVLIDKNMTRAKVYFSLVYQGGEADFIKTDSGWIMINSGLTWIE